MGVKVLVVEDDVRIGSSICIALDSHGYTTRHVVSGEEAYFLATTEVFDLVVLDLGLPGRDGLQVLKALRAVGKKTLILILSARSEVEERVAGLLAGADDYLGKPFSMVELEARLLTLLRRGRPDATLRFSEGDLTLDVALREVKRADRVLDLTSLEFDLLEMLIRRARSIVSRGTLATEVWQESNRAPPLGNVIDVHIGRLRKKIEPPGSKPLIHTVRGVGFILSEHPPR